MNYHQFDTESAYSPLVATKQPPIYDLPPELLSCIVKCLLPSDENGWSSKNIWGLASVCRYWRKLLRSNPAWWVWITFTTSNTGLSGSRARSVDLQLVLSKPLPIHVYVWGYHSAPGFILSCHTILHPHLSRIHSVRIAATYQYIPLLSAAVKYPIDSIPILPSLTTLHLTCTVGGFLADGAGLVLDRTNAPALKRVHLAEWYGSNKVELPWSQLEELFCEQCGIENIVAVIPQLDAKSLRGHLGITFYEGQSIIDEIDALQLQSVARTFPHITSFTFGMGPEDSAGSQNGTFSMQHYILSRFYFPMLSSLTIMGIWLDNQKPLAPSSFIYAISSSLTQLHLINVNIVITDGHSMIQQAHHTLEELFNLEHLEVVNTAELQYYRDCLSPLSRWVMGLLGLLGGLCPKLHSLAISQCTKADFSALLNLVHLRMDPITVPVRDRKLLRSFIFQYAYFDNNDFEGNEYSLQFRDYNDSVTKVAVRRL